jgi:uncharacterized protein (DUF1501 family)
MISRRRLIAGAGGVGAASALGAFGGSWLPSASLPGGPNDTADASPATPARLPDEETSREQSTAAANTDRVLVVLQLGGGNDALNTLVPTDGRYRDARRAIAISDESLLAIPGVSDYGLHPAFAPMRSMIDAGQVGVAAGVGFVGNDRSHFAAFDTWWAGQVGGGTTGWLGRWLDATGDADSPAMRAVGVGGAPPSLRASQSRVTSVQDPENFSLLMPAGVNEAALEAAWQQLGGSEALAASLGSSHRDAAAAIATFDAMDLGSQSAGRKKRRRMGGNGFGATSAATGLTAAASLIASDPTVRVVHVSISGFDTHARQLDTHAQLLADVATGIASMFAALTTSGDADRVLLMTVSEFGRRVVENASEGTDHGKAGALWLAGPAVNGGVIGELNLADLDDGDLRSTVDARSLYATALDWLAGPTDEILGGSFERLALLR